jgi:hypothetical protein
MDPHWYTAMTKQSAVCTMCGKSITDSTKVLTKNISGKYVEFDSVDCAGIYERLHSVYGNSIEL